MKNLFKDFYYDSKGNVILLFAAILPILLISVASFMEYTLILNTKQSAQSALDVATLASVKNINKLDEAELEKAASSFFDMNFPYKQEDNSFSKIIELLEIKHEADKDKGSLKLTANVSMKNNFSGIIGDKYHKFSVSSSASMASSSGADVNLIMVLDVSGSMYWKPMVNLKKATDNFVDYLKKNDHDIPISMITFSQENGNPTLADDILDDKSTISDYSEIIEFIGGLEAMGAGHDKRKGLMSCASEILQYSETFFDDEKQNVIMFMHDGDGYDNSKRYKADGCSDKHPDIIRQCEKLIKKGAKIIGVRFTGNGDGDVDGMFKKCTQNPSLYFKADSASEMEKSFVDGLLKTGGSTSPKLTH